MTADINIRETRNLELELARSNRALRMFSACNEVFLRASDEQSLLTGLCRIAVEIGGYRMAWVGYADDDAARSIVIKAQVGDVTDYLGNTRLSWSEQEVTGRGPAGRTVRSGKTVVCEALVDDPSFLPWLGSAQRSGFGGLIDLPLRDGKRTFGVLGLMSADVHHAGADEIKLLEQLADDLAFGIGNVRAQKERQQIQSAALKIATGVSAAAGSDFFEQLARNMAEALGADAAFVAKILPGSPRQVRTLAAVVDGDMLEGFDYFLAGTPCELLLHEPDFCIPGKAIELYPEDRQLSALGIQACVGQRLDGGGGQQLGMLFVLFRRVLRRTTLTSTTLKIFASRAATELERQESDGRLRQQAALLDQARDAIIVRGLDRRILFWNKGAERLYGWTAEEVLGRAQDELLNTDASQFHDGTEKVLAEGEWAGEVSQRRQNGSVLIVESRLTLMRDERGAPLSILAINTDITERKAVEDEIQHLAFHDPLTQLPNRLLLLERLDQAMTVSTRTGHVGALLFLDLDHFKTLNDTLGHDMGDLLLQQVAERLQFCLRACDTVARLGGDEFVVMLEGLSGHMEEAAAQARMLGEKILATFAPAFLLNDYEHFCTPSMGITLFDGHQDTVGELLKRADLAMYQAKASGRNALRFFDPEMQAVVDTRVELEADLRRGLQAQEFVLHFQPQVDADGRMTGAEALLRWHHPRRGLMMPGWFIALAEDTGQILPLGQWVLEAACLQLAEWGRSSDARHLEMAVNISARQFYHPDFVEQVLATVERTGANPRLLKLELTESLLLTDYEEIIGKMGALKARGISFSLDDFGTGYSSLAYLKRLPLNQLKIDQSFVRDILTDPNDAAIAKTIVALGQTLGLSVIAEGVETEEQLTFLAVNGCNAYQGYLFSPALSVPDLIQFMATHL
jgi:diguanylate cyclase (GGDEF)-like protein/PAS domain S-box-containing protein